MIFGIDTASVAGNKDPNWTKAKAAGISFAIIRSNYGASEDKQFKREWPRIEKAGLVRGAYLFLRFPFPGKPKPALPEKQAQAMVDAIRAAAVAGVGQLAFPPTVDVEFPGKGRKETGMSVDECIDWVRRAVGVVKNQFGCIPMLYTSARVWRDDLKNYVALDLLDCPLWLARYYVKAGPASRDPAIFESGRKDPPVPIPWGPNDGDCYFVHQYQGNATGLPGFSGKVDMNRFNPLFKGAIGARVRWLQRRLRIKEDGKFGPKTEKACRDLQVNHGLVSDGIVGPRTFSILCWMK